MSAISTIEWTDRTWNPVRGCSIVSPGCVNCYAMKQAHRFGGTPGRPGPYAGLTKQTGAGPQWTGVVRTVEKALLEPLSWRKPARVFVNSMSDLFHEDVPDEFINRVFAVMALAPQHTFQILTKRADRMKAWFERWPNGMGRFHHVNLAALSILKPDWMTTSWSSDSPENVRANAAVNQQRWPLPNVWIGVSCENQEQADKRIQLLLQTPAAVRWVSAEPLLGSVNLRELPSVSGIGRHFDSLSNAGAAYSDVPSRLDWVVVGGESGPGARPFDLAWARSIVEQCKAAAVPVFVKQLGAQPWVKTANHYGPGVDARPFNVRYHLKDRKGGDINEWPKDLRVREWPRVEVSA